MLFYFDVIQDSMNNTSRVTNNLNKCLIWLWESGVACSEICVWFIYLFVYIFIKLQQDRDFYQNFLLIHHKSLMNFCIPHWYKNKNNFSFKIVTEQFLLISFLWKEKVLTPDNVEINALFFKCIWNIWIIYLYMRYIGIITSGHQKSNQ